MVAWNLPAELDDIVLDHLHDDRESLAKCALVRRSWVPTARYHNWRDLQLTCSEKELRELEKVLHTSPEVVHLVRSVFLTQGPDDERQWYDLQILHIALNLLSRFPTVSSLTLHGLWFGVSKQTQPLNLVLPSVRQLTISSCTFDTFDTRQIAKTFPSLSVLRFDGVWWGRWGSDDPALIDIKGQTPPLPGLKEIYLGKCHSRDSVVDWLLSSCPRPLIHTLRLPFVSAYDTRLKHLLAFLGPSLSHLELGSPSLPNPRSADRSSGEQRTVETYLDLARNTALRSVQLGVPTARAAQYTSLWLAAVLAQIASPMLEEVRFALSPIPSGSSANAERILRAFDWRQVVKILEGPSYGSLRRVVFEYGRSTASSGGVTPSSPQQILQKVVLDYFVRLEKRSVKIIFEI